LFGPLRWKKKSKISLADDPAMPLASPLEKVEIVEMSKLHLFHK
jgi:hypothetical protein